MLPYYAHIQLEEYYVNEVHGDSFLKLPQSADAVIVISCSA
jgi:hypothetical protein